MKKNIIQSATEPDKNSLWLSPQGLKKFSKKGWELIGGNTCGSDTPSDPSSGSSDIYTVPLTFSLEEGEQQGDYLIQQGTLDSTTAKEIIQANKDNKLVQLKFKADESSGIAVVLNSIYYTNENNIEFAMWDGTYIPELASVIAIKFYVDKEPNTYTYSLTLQFKQEEGGGSNDYVLPFTTEGNIDSKYFDEIKEAINSGKTIKHKNSNGSYRTIDYTIVKDAYIYCFIGNFDENTQIIDISNYGRVFEYNICSSGNARKDININGDTSTQPALKSGYINFDYGHPVDDKLFGYRLNIFDIFTGECKMEDDIYTVYFHRERSDIHTVLGQCIIYSDSNNAKRITILNKQMARDISIPGFVYAKGLVEGIEYEERPTNYGDIFYINLRDYEYGPGDKNNFEIPYPEERTSILLNSPLVSFKLFYNSCIYKNNTIDQLANELRYNKELIKGIAEINYLVNLDDYHTTDELNSWYTKCRNGIKLRFYRDNVYYDIYKATDYRNYYAIWDVKTHINFRWVNVGDDNWRFESIKEIIPEVTTGSSGLMPASLYNKVNNIITTGDGTKYLSDDGSYNTINNILIIDYSDINENLPQNYTDITNKPLYITGLWDYTPDNGSLTKRFIPAIYTYNGSGSFTINYKVDISGSREKKQIVGMIYYNGVDKINHTYHTVCPSYTINLNVQDGTNTGTFDNNMIIYREVRQTIYGGGQIVIKGTDTTNYVEAEAVDTDYIVLRWSVSRIGEDGTSVTLSVYELKLTPEDYTTKVIHKTI